MSWTIKAEESDQLKMGTEVEREHADTIKWLIEQLSHSGGQGDNPVDKLVTEVATKIAQEHLKEIPDYYTRLKDMETAKRKPSADAFHKNLKKSLGQENE